MNQPETAELGASARPMGQWALLYAKGLAMGLADLVPGVSGGTIAFITGIYDELLSTIASLKIGLLTRLPKTGIPGTWREANLSFLVVLVGGILTSALLFAGTLHWLLENKPIELWGFFFGLVAASIPLVGRYVGAWKGSTVLLAALGAVTAAFLTSLPPLVQSDAPVFLAVCGAIAICAMILPGISGSFILLILGAYAPVIAAIKGFDLVRIAAFGAGAIIGLLGFSRVLRWLLSRHRGPTLAILTGFLLGSLNALWPWKSLVRELYTHSDGRVEWLKTNTLPESLGQILPILGLAVLGAVLVTGLDRWGRALSGSTDASTS